MGVTWAATWAAFGFVPRWILGMQGDLPFPILFAGLGFIAGITFSVLLALTEGRRRFDQMSLPRFAAWGATSGVLLAALFLRATAFGLGELLAIPATFAAASAACAAGSLALARRGARRELLEVPVDAAKADLTNFQEHKLL